MTPPDAPDAPRDLLDRLEKVVTQGSLEEAAAWGEISGADLLALVQRVRTAEAETARLREVLAKIASYKLVGTEMTLHIDFQGWAKAALVGASRPGEGK